MLYSMPRTCKWMQDPAPYSFLAMRSYSFWLQWPCTALGMTEAIRRYETRRNIIITHKNKKEKEMATWSWTCSLISHPNNKKKVSFDKPSAPAIRNHIGFWWIPCSMWIFVLLIPLESSGLIEPRANKKLRPVTMKPLNIQTHTPRFTAKASMRFQRTTRNNKTARVTAIAFSVKVSNRPQTQFVGFNK